MQTVYLSAQAQKRLKTGHLWVFSNEIDNKKSPLKQIEQGEQVLLEGPDGKTIGYAFINPQSLIAGRIVSRKNSLSQTGLKKRIEQALAMREQFYDAPFYRLVYGEGDFLPGLIIDRYNDVAVVQINSFGYLPFKEGLVDILQRLGMEKVVLRNDGNSRKQEGLELEANEVFGDAPETVEIIENDTRFLVPVLKGQKTGWFYDHRDNRDYVAKLCQGKTVLDVFSYMGAWGLAALTKGASHLTAVDISGQALDVLEQNAKLNGFEDKVECLQGNAADGLEALLAEGKKFDVIVLDPPAFIKKKKDFHKGLAAYKKYNELALRLLAPNGLLVAASCSMHLGEADLQQAVQKAARHIDRDLRLVHRGGHSADHPIHPAIKETDYLKAQVYQLR